MDELNWLGWEGGFALLPLHVAISSIAATLFAGALVGRAYASNAALPATPALRHFTALFAFYGVLVTVLRMLAVVPHVLLLTFPPISGHAEIVYEACEILSATLPAILLFVPVLIVREGTGVIGAISTNAKLWWRNPGRMLSTIALFAVVALVIQSIVALVLSPLSRSWLAVVAVRQWTELTLAAILLVAATRWSLYICIRDRPRYF